MCTWQRCESILHFACRTIVGRNNSCYVMQNIVKFLLPSHYRRDKKLLCTRTMRIILFCWKGSRSCTFLLSDGSLIFYLLERRVIKKGLHPQTTQPFDPSLHSDANKRVLSISHRNSESKMSREERYCLGKWKLIEP